MLYEVVVRQDLNWSEMQNKCFLKTIETVLMGQLCLLFKKNKKNVDLLL